MIEPQTNNDALFRQKFENFAVQPSENTWKGILAGLPEKAVVPFYIQYWKPIAVAAVAVIVVTAGLIFMLPDSGSEIEVVDQSVLKSNDTGDIQIKTPERISDTEKTISTEEVDQMEMEKQLGEKKTNNVSDKLDVQPVSKKDPPESLKTAEVSNTINTDADLKEFSNTGHQENLAIIDTKHDVIELKSTALMTNTESEIMKPQEISTVSNSSLENTALPQMIWPPSADVMAAQPKIDYSGWTTGLYFTPELMLNTFDSVELRASYSLGIEPTWYINNHLFLRFGIGATYSRDQGFANLDYLNNELLGSYDYVYDITFDSIDGQVVPNYHTKTMEVWDTVHHFKINSITNKYVYLQLPVLVGYHKSSTNFRWYVYGGPAVNYMISKQIDQPEKGIDYDEMLSVKNELPKRSTAYFQLWLGAGIEYKMTQRLGVAIEPNYRYYFKNVFNELPYSNSALSGLSVRFGLVYTIH